MVLFEIGTQTLPWALEFPRQLFVSKLAEILPQGQRPQLPPAVALPAAYVALMSSCWETDPARRPRFVDIVADPCFARDPALEESRM